MGLQVFPVTPHVWCLRRSSYLTCSYLVQRSNGQIVAIDAGIDSEARDVASALSIAFGAKIEDIHAVLLTHWHNDHAAGARAIQERGAAKIYYHQGDLPEFTRATASKGIPDWFARHTPELGPLVLLKGLFGAATPRAVTATRLVRDGEIVEQDFEVIETPGHTSGHLSFFYAPERILFAGDALATVRSQLRFMSRPVTQNLEDARRSMKKCLERPIEHICPGHRAPLSNDVSAHCAQMLERLERNKRWPLLG